jgi:hypothetical protein
MWEIDDQDENEEMMAMERMGKEGERARGEDKESHQHTSQSLVDPAPTAT